MQPCRAPEEQPWDLAPSVGVALAGRPSQAYQGPQAKQAGKSCFHIICVNPLCPRTALIWRTQEMILTATNVKVKAKKDQRGSDFSAATAECVSASLAWSVSLK